MSCTCLSGFEDEVLTWPLVGCRWNGSLQGYLCVNTMGMSGRGVTWTRDGALDFTPHLIDCSFELKAQSQRGVASSAAIQALEDEGKRIWKFKNTQRGHTERKKKV